MGRSRAHWLACLSEPSERPAHKGGWEGTRATTAWPSCHVSWQLLQGLELGSSTYCRWLRLPVTPAEGL